MRSRTSQQHVADVARRRLEQLSAELAAIRPESVESPVPDARGGSGEPSPPILPGVAADPPAGPPGRHAHRPLGTGERVAGWLGDRLPAGLQGRVALGAGHVVAVLLLVLAGLGVTAWWWARAGGGSEAVPRVSSAAPLVSATSGGAAGAAAGGSTGPSAGPSAAGAATPTASGSAAATGTIVVDVAGKVRRPGIATLPLGSRVVDALHAAGGARRGVTLGALNLARVLSDGEQIVVGGPAPAGGAAGAAVGGGAAGAATAAGSAGASAVPMVDVNTASQAQLEELPDIGPVTARAILDYRSENGPFGAVDDLLDVSGIGDATLAKIAPYVTL